MSNSNDNFVKTFIGILSALVIFTIIISIIAAKLIGEVKVDTVKKQSVDAHIKPVGTVKVAIAIETPVATETPSEATPEAATPTETTAPAATETIDGAATYNTACLACHMTGAAGAPILGDKTAWAARIAKGVDALYAGALNGINGMPAKGGRTDLSDAAVKAAVDHMIAGSQ